MSVEPLRILIDGLAVDDRIVQARAAGLLGELGATVAVEPLTKYVTTCRYHSKTAGLTALGQIGDRSVTPTLQGMLTEPNCEDDWYWIGYKSVRAATAVALLALGDDAGVATLTELADKDDAIFFAWFAPAILRLPDNPPATATLKARLTAETCYAQGPGSTRLTDQGPLAMVTEALGLLGTDAATARLVELLKAPSRYVRGQAALSLLAAAPTAEHMATVEALATDDETDFARVKALLALALTGRIESVAAIAAAAETAEDAFDQAAAVEALGLAGSPEPIDLIAEKLTHDDAYVRLCAVEAIERIEGESSVGRIAPLLQDPSIHVRLQAAKAVAAAGRASTGGPQA